jgi:hypothetical protein
MSGDPSDICGESRGTAEAGCLATEVKRSERGESLYVYFWRIFFASLNEYAKDPLGLKDLEILSSALLLNQSLFEVGHVRDTVENSNALLASVDLSFQYVNGALVSRSDDGVVSIFAQHVACKLDIGKLISGHYLQRVILTGRQCARQNF